MNKELQELSGMIENILRKVSRSDDFLYPDEEAVLIADGVLNLGYHKQVWHKVADGDLPKRSNKDIYAVPVQAYYIDNSGLRGNGPLYYFFLENTFRSLGSTAAVKVIAWTELPTYEE